MNMKRKILLMFFMLAILSSRAFALFEAPYWGVRAFGMGTAFTAVSNDVNAPVYNIAGIGGMEKAEITAMSSKLFTGLEGVDISVSYIGVVIPISQKIGSIAGAWAHYGATGMYSEDIFSLGYGRSLSDVIKISWVDLLVGVNFKYITHAIKGNSKKLGDVDTEKGAFTLDVGAIARFNNGISVGYSSKYLNQPDVAFGLVDLGNGKTMKDEVDIINTVGIAYYAEELPLIALPYFTIAVDYEMRRADGILAVGAETKIIDGSLALRAGGWGEQLNFGIGYALKFGEGEKASALMIDYAFGLPISDVQETSGHHYIGLSYRFP